MLAKVHNVLLKYIFSGHSSGQNGEQRGAPTIKGP